MRQMCMKFGSVWSSSLLEKSAKFPLQWSFTPNPTFRGSQAYRQTDKLLSQNDHSAILTQRPRVSPSQVTFYVPAMVFAQDVDANYKYQYSRLNDIVYILP